MVCQSSHQQCHRQKYYYVTPFIRQIKNTLFVAIIPVSGLHRVLSISGAPLQYTLSTSSPNNLTTTEDLCKEETN